MSLQIVNLQNVSMMTQLEILMEILAQTGITITHLLVGTTMIMTLLHQRNAAHVEEDCMELMLSQSPQLVAHQIFLLQIPLETVAIGTIFMLDNTVKVPGTTMTLAPLLNAAPAEVESSDQKMTLKKLTNL